MVASKLLPDCSGLSPMCIACLLLDCSVSVLLEEHIEASETCQGRPRAGYILSHPHKIRTHDLLSQIPPRFALPLFSKGGRWDFAIDCKRRCPNIMCSDLAQ